jgi:putative MATE family efflux protein
MQGLLGKDMTSGSVPKQLLKFALPIFFGNIIYSGYGVINTVWVGKLLGQNAVGATAVSLPVVFILAGLVMGATTATSVLVAQYAGSKDAENLERAVGTSFTVSAALAALLTAGGMLLCGWILRAMDTPAEILPMAQGYLTIMMAGTALMYAYFLFSAILRGLGDSTTMLVIMLASTAVNALLDPLLIAGFGSFPKMGLNGAAAATLISQGLGLMGALAYLARKKTLKPGAGLFRFHAPTALRLARIALPSVFQACFVQIGTMFITSFVNSYGAAATAALGAAGRVDSIALMPAAAMNMAVAAQAGQCIGAGREERTAGVFRWGALINALATLPVAALALAVPGALLGMFLGPGEAMAVGTDYLRILCASYLMASVFYVSNGVMTGAGRTLFPMAVSLFSLWAVRVPLSALLMRTGLGIRGIWVAVLVSFAVNLALSLALYFSGAWRKKQAVKPPAQPAIMEMEPGE